MAGKAELLFSEVLNAIRHLEEKKSGLDPVNGGTKMSESRCQLPDLEGTLLKDKLEFEVWNHIKFFYSSFFYPVARLWMTHVGFSLLVLM